MPYLTLGVTEGVDTQSVVFFSEEIMVNLPVGVSTITTHVQV